MNDIKVKVFGRKPVKEGRPGSYTRVDQDDLSARGFVVDIDGSSLKVEIHDKREANMVCKLLNEVYNMGVKNGEDNVAGKIKGLLKVRD